MTTIEPKQLEAKVFNLKAWIEEIEAKKLVDFFQNELEKAEFKILNFVSNDFPNKGFTAVWVLAESHLALHSFAESGWTYFELTSCNLSKAECLKRNILASKANIKFGHSGIEESKL